MIKFKPGELSNWALADNLQGGINGFNSWVI